MYIVKNTHVEEYSENEIQMEIKNQYVEKYSENEIQMKIKNLALQIETNYRKIYKDNIIPHLVCCCVLKGAVRFFNDLIKYLTLPIYIDFIQLSSYKGSTISSKNIELIKDITLDPILINQHDVLIVEDIIDTGYTMKWLIDHINQKFKPKSIQIATLLNKTGRREIDIYADYIAINDPSADFLVGFGLDDNELYRELNSIYIKVK